MENKDEVLTCRIPAELKQSFEEKAKTDNCSVSEVVRRSLLAMTDNEKLAKLREFDKVVFYNLEDANEKEKQAVREAFPGLSIPIENYDIALVRGVAEEIINEMRRNEKKVQSMIKDYTKAKNNPLLTEDLPEGLIPKEEEMDYKHKKVEENTENTIDFSKKANNPLLTEDFNDYEDCEM